MGLRTLSKHENGYLDYQTDDYSTIFEGVPMWDSTPTRTKILTANHANFR